jgi:starvation-inducible outer membrane lipoprotein
MTALSRSFVVGLVALGLVFGCSPVPKKYLREAVPNVRLSQLAAMPRMYEGKLVVMGAAIHDEETRGGTLWLHVRNRPLDQDYRPQLPPSADDPEAGSYWVFIAAPRDFPPSYRHWADMTVVGRVEPPSPGNEPVIKMVYVRGWGLKSEHDGVWEGLLDANYVPLMPSGAIGEGGQSPP